MNAWCAVCTSERGPFVQRPLGKGDAMVAVCAGCDEEHPRSGRYAFDDSSVVRGVGQGNGRNGINGGTHKTRGDK